ncbi:MAG: PilZ domain-containing protein [Thermoanaerobaculia bacterium]|nr:PilZ domain-containing protein [Thermoanaerobaculia bacterium]
MNRRREIRHEVQLPVELQGGRGRTHDMSASGAYIETADFDVPVGGSFEFSVTIDSGTEGPWTVRCQGLVIRIEKHENRIGVAASIDRYLEFLPQMSGLEKDH